MTTENQTSGAQAAQNHETDAKYTRHNPEGFPLFAVFVEKSTLENGPHDIVFARGKPMSHGDVALIETSPEESRIVRYVKMGEKEVFESVTEYFSPITIDEKLRYKVIGVKVFINITRP